MEKPNRAERRRNKFGGGRATEHGGWPTHLPNPVFGAEAPETPAPPPATATDAPTEPDTKSAGSAPAADDEASAATKA